MNASSTSYRSTAAGSSHRPIVPFPRASAIVGYGVLSGVFLLLVLELCCWALLGARNWVYEKQKLQAFTRIAGPLHCRGGDCPASGEFGASPALDGYPWAEELWRHLRSSEKQECDDGCLTTGRKPYVEWTSGAVNSRYLNADKTRLGVVRRTIADAQSCRATPISIWVFGGSEVWGFGVADEATIPSLLARELSARGTCARVTNFGVLGYSTTQELVQLSLLLRDGNAPDTAIFLDGFNDAYIAANEPAPGYPMGFSESRRTQQNPIASLLGNTHIGLVARRMLNRTGFGSSPLPPVTGAAAEAVSKKTVDIYEANVRAISDIARVYGFRTFFFWQPSPYYGRKPLVPYEQAIVNWNLPYGPFVTTVHNEVARRSPDWPRFQDLAGVFDSIPQAMYLDDVHTGPEANRLIAVSIAKVISSEPATAGTAMARQP